MIEVCDRSSTRPGVDALRRLVAERREAPPTRNDFESAFLDLCREHGLEPPLVNTQLEGFEVDALWRAQKLVIELDSFAFHGSHAAFEGDRRRDVALQLAGYRVLRFTHGQVEDEPRAVANSIRRLVDPVA